jgi:prepilin-type processing-associated H-X9-DG protein
VLLPHASRFTWSDLVTCAVVLAATCATATVVVGRARETADRVKCASNLRQIGQGMMMYAADNRGALPRAVFEGTGTAPTEYTRPTAPNPFQPGGPGPNDVTAGMFLLLRTQDLTSHVFVCPSCTDQEPWDLGGKAQNQVSNFPGRQYLGYSFANPYASPAAVAAGFKWDNTLTSDFAVAADMNPGPPGVVSVDPLSPRRQMQTANGLNYNGDGQNVLYADGHVELQNTPFCGMLRTPAAGQPYRDNIYTYGAGYGGATGVGVRGSPVDGLDSVLLPTALDGPAPTIILNRPFTWAMAGVGAAVVLSLFLTIRLLFRRPRNTTTTV